MDKKTDYVSGDDLIKVNRQGMVESGFSSGDDTRKKKAASGMH